MRTTLDLDPDVLLAVKGLAKQRGVSMGNVLSELACEALTRQAAITTRNGVPLFPIQLDAGVVTMERINRLRDGAP